MQHSREFLKNIPSYVDAPKGVFRDVNHYRAVLAGITKALAKGKQGYHSQTSGSYLFDGLQVEFSTRCVEEEIFLDHLNSKIVLRAPKKPRESEKELSMRRIYYLGQLLREVEAMKTIGITQIYLTLREDGRKKLERSQEVSKSRSTRATSRK